MAVNAPKEVSTKPLPFQNHVQQTILKKMKGKREKEKILQYCSPTPTFHS